MNGAKVISHGRYLVFQMAEVAITRQMFQKILRLIGELRPQPPRASMRRPCSCVHKRREECVQIPWRMTRSAPQSPFELPE